MSAVKVRSMGQPKRALCILSGGMDSAVSMWIAMAQGYEIVALHFEYKQRTHLKERKSFDALCDVAGVQKRYVIALPFFETIGASALTDLSIKVPTDGIKPGIPVTYVPFRNGIFLSIATALAEKEGCEAIFIGVVQEDSSGYPDCRATFIEAMEQAIMAGTKGDVPLRLHTPLIDMSKAQIVQKGFELHVPLELTWSCYAQNDQACGVCDSCRLRLKGFKEAGKNDPIAYKVSSDEAV